VEAAFDPKVELMHLTRSYPHLDADILTHLSLTYGSAAPAVLGWTKDDPATERRIVPGLPYIWAEIPYVVQHEMALTLNDFLIRRTHVIHEDRDQGLGCASGVATAMAQHLGWDAAEVERQIEGYREQVSLTQAFRTERRQEEG
jgi:glycerol-3-phosphate dehydrogenase